MLSTGLLSQPSCFPPRSLQHLQTGREHEVSATDWECHSEVTGEQLGAGQVLWEEPLKEGSDPTNLPLERIPMNSGVLTLS